MNGYGGRAGAAEGSVQGGDRENPSGGDGRAPGLREERPRGEQRRKQPQWRRKKTVKSELGEAEIMVPRDRSGEFEPQARAKRRTSTGDPESRILAMYSRGKPNRDMAANPAEDRRTAALNGALLNP